MRQMRIRFVKLGGHYHCRVFTAPTSDQTFAKCGELVFDEDDWKEIALMFKHAQFLPGPRPEEAK